MPNRSWRLAALAVLVVSAAASASFAQTAGSAALKLAVVDMDRVMSESLMGKSEQMNIDKLRNNRAALIDQKQKELEEQEEQIRNASLSWSAEKREERLREYQTKQIELRRLNEDATRDVQAEFNKSLGKLQNVALRITGKIGSEQGFTLILERGSAPVLFASDAIDITSEVIARMDQESRPAAAAAPSGGSR